MQNIVPKRLPLVFMPHMACSLEYDGSNALFHIEYMNKATPDTIKFLKWYTEDVLETVVDHGYDHLFAAVPLENSQGQKIAKLIGFEYLTDNEGFAIYRR